MREKFVAAIVLALAKFRFKHFSPVRESSDIQAIAEIWVDELISQKVTQSEMVGSLNWLMANKPEFPDIADVLSRVNHHRSKQYALLMVDNIGIEVDGRLSIVARSSPEGQAEIARREQECLPDPSEMKQRMEELMSRFETEVVPQKKIREVRELVSDPEGEDQARRNLAEQVKSL